MFLLSLICLICTSVNNAKINDLYREFTYSTDENGDVVLSLEGERTVSMRFSESSVQVKKSYKAIGREDSLMVAVFAKRFATDNGKIVKDTTEMYGEYRLHNLLYGLGIKREQTADTDLDYERDKRWYVNLLSKVIGWVGL